MNLQRMFSTLIGVCGAVILAGCGGGGGGGAPAASDGRGAIQMAIHWPAVSRLVPIDSQAIVVVVKTTGGSVIASPPLVTRPIGTNPVSNVKIPGLPSGPVVVYATAFPQPDGSGNAQATGSLPVTVIAGATTTTKPLVMNTTVTKIVLTPSATTVAVGGQITVSASAEDANGNVVVVARDHYVGTVYLGTVIDTTDFIIVQAASQFTLTAKTAGTFSFSVKEPESGVTSAVVPIGITTPLTTPKILIVDAGNKRIVGLDAIPPTTTVTYDDSISGTAFQGVVSVTRDSSGRIYVGDYYRGIVRIDDFTGNNRIVYAPPGIAIDAVYVDKAGKIYWTDSNATINRVDDMTGSNRVAFGNRTVLGYNIDSIAVDSQNRVYTFGAQVVRISDITNNSTSSPNVTLFGGSGTGINQFSGYGGLAVDSKNRIYVADSNNSRIVRIDDMTGLNWTAFNIPKDSGALVIPVSVAVDSRSTPTIYFLDSGAGGASKVFKMTDMTGAGLTKLGTLANGVTALKNASAISVK